MHMCGCVYWCIFFPLPSNLFPIYLKLCNVLFIFSFTISTLLPSVPGNLILQVISSASIRVTWTPPPNAERLPLTYHVGYSSEFTGRMSTTTTELSLILTSLYPFDEYTVTVEAENNGGRGGPVVRKATTLSAGMCRFLYLSHISYEWISAIL